MRVRFQLTQCTLMSLQSILAFFFITLPWLNPFPPGPSPAAVPLLFSWACAAALLGACSRVPGRRLAGRLVSAAAWAWLVAGLLSSVMGLGQYFGAGGSFLPWMNQTELGEAFANLRQRNQFATLTNISLAALVWLATTGRFAGRTRWLVWAAAGLLAAGNAASSSRTGLVQLGLLCVMFWAWGGWRPPAVRRVLLAAVLAYALATLALPWLAGLDLSLFGMVARLRAGDQICASRLTLWSNVLHLIAQHPWLGWGWGELDYAHYITLYDGPRFCAILDNAHNLPLQLAVELGIPVALLVCGGLTWWVVRARPWFDTDPTRQMAWAILALILLHSLLEYPLWYGPFQIAFGLCVALLWATRPGKVSTSNRPVALDVRAQVATISIAFVLLTAVMYAAWDYHRISQIYLPPEQRDAAYGGDTLGKVGDSWLFRDQVRFAELTITALTQDNAPQIHALASELLHYSPEPRVIEKLIESAVLLGHDDEALFHLVRFRAAFPKEHAAWAEENARLVHKLRSLSP